MDALPIAPIAIGLPGVDEPSESVPVDPAAAAHLTGPQKAALIVRELAKEGAAQSLNQLPDEIQANLIEQLGQLGKIEQPVIDAVVAEFSAALDIAALTGTHGLRRALEMLDGSLSPGVARQLRSKASDADIGDPWGPIGERDAETLLPLIDGQSAEIASVILSKIPVPKAAELLGLMPGDKARRLAYGISQINAVSPKAVRRIGIAVTRMLSIEPDRAFDDGPAEMVGAILNFSRASTRDDVLEGLDQTDADFAKEVRRTIFTFSNISERLSASDIPALTRAVDQDTLVKALAAAAQGKDENVAEFILGGLSQRMGDNLRNEMQDLGEVDEEVGEEAMGAVVSAIRELENLGEIHLILGDD